MAAFFHDAAIWLDDTWDYLQPSVDRALEELTPDEEEHAPLVSALINEHHRVRKARHEHPLVEAFRRADMTDVYFGLPKSPGVPRKTYRSIVSEYPATRFRRVLARAFLRGLRENPLRPMPMVKF